MSRPLTWIMSGGGPLIVVAATLAPLWHGNEVPWPMRGGPGATWDEVRTRSDYGRACGIAGDLGALPVGPGHALVLRGEPSPTTFLRDARGGVLVGWDFEVTAEQVRAAVRSVPRGDWVARPEPFAVAAGGIRIGDAAYPGDELPLDPLATGAIPVGLQVPLPPGTYRAASAAPEFDEVPIFLATFRRVAAG